MNNQYPPILDATCGGRMMWFDKHNPLCLYIDNRKLEETHLCDGRTFSVSPDMMADFTALPFDDNTFYQVVFDPPHLIRVNDDAYLKIKFGRLPKEWKDVIHDGFWECMRVLKPYGTLIFKWSEVQIPTREVINAIGKEPLFGHRSGKKMNTHWMVYMKLEEGKDDD
jgi:hypothetical protein